MLNNIIDNLKQLMTSEIALELFEENLELLPVADTMSHHIANIVKMATLSEQDANNFKEQ